MLEWNVFMVDERPRRACYLVPLSHEWIFEHGLPRSLIVGELMDAEQEVMSDEPGGLDYERFRPNAEFVRLLHAVLARHVRDCPGILAEAQRLGEGSVYVIDARTPTPRGAVPPADIIGEVAIRSGNPVAYRGSPRYEVFGRNGLMRLDPWLEERFGEEILKLTQERARR
jgi:hypothetical protein